MKCEHPECELEAITKIPVDISINGEKKKLQLCQMHLDSVVEELAAMNEEVIEMMLCEQNHLVLRPGVLYRFSVGKDCKECQEIAETFEAHDNPKKKALYSFNWKQGGFNAVWAHTEEEALEVIAKEFGTCGLTPDRRTFVRRDTQESQNQYWNNIPLMD